jgi:hypothetical protein
MTTTLTIQQNGHINIDVQSGSNFSPTDLNYTAEGGIIDSRPNGVGTIAGRFGSATLASYAETGLLRMTSSEFVDDYNSLIDQLAARPLDTGLQVRVAADLARIETWVTSANNRSVGMADVFPSISESFYRELTADAIEMGMSPEEIAQLAAGAVHYLAERGLPITPEGCGDFLVAYENHLSFFPEYCFPAGTPIDLPGQPARAIEQLSLSEVVSAFDSSLDSGRGALTSARIVRLYENVTDCFVRLEFPDDREPVHVTPGHRFLDETGGFTKIGDLLKLGGDSARVIDADGQVVTVSGSMIHFSAETAHLFERASVRAMSVNGNTIFKHDAASSLSSCGPC